MNKNKGFTLIETSITLLIISIFIMYPVITFEKVIHSLEINSFFRELTSNLTLMQNHAITSDERTEVIITPKKNTIQFRVCSSKGDANHYLNREMDFSDKKIKIKDLDMKQINFKKGTGDIIMRTPKGWTTLFTTERGDYKLVFQLGSGRFEIRKN